MDQGTPSPPSSGRRRSALLIVLPALASLALASLALAGYVVQANLTIAASIFVAIWAVLVGLFIAVLLVSVWKVWRVDPAGLFGAGSVGNLPRCPSIVAAFLHPTPKSLAGPQPPGFPDGHLGARFWRRVRAEARERKEAERGLTRLTELAESLQDMVIIWEQQDDGTRVFTYVSPSSTAMLGITPEALCANPRLLRFHPDDVARLRARFQMFTNGVIDNATEHYRLLRADGTTVWVEVVSNAVAHGPAEGHPRRHLSCFRDISARREAEAALIEANRRLESLTTNSPVTLYEMRMRLQPDGSSDIVSQFVTGSAMRLTGYAREQLQTPGFLKSIADPDYGERRQAFIRQIRAEGRATMEYHLRNIVGDRLKLRDTGFLTLLSRTDMVVTGFVRDVTDESLLHEQLREASKLSFLGEMAAGIAHELHQPLAAIELQAETLALEIPAATPGREKVLARVEKISTLVERAGSVIRRIRAFSRRDTTAAAAFDPLAAIDEALEIIASRIAERRITLSRSYPDVTTMVFGHRTPFEQVIMNLVANAVDTYGPAEDDDLARRVVRIAVASSEGGVEITVADRGGGIAPGAIGRVFEPFFTTKAQGAGTGLGLSISYRIVQDMGGQIRATNRDGGAVFTVLLPAVVEAPVSMP